MEKKKKGNLFNKILVFLFVMFLCLYSISMNGYHNRENEYKSFYTKEMIEKFEHDVESGKNVDINEYLAYEEKDFSNKVSELGEKISDGIDFASSKSLELFSNLFTYLFE